MLRLLVLHDDAEREFDYVAGAEGALDRARSEGWTVASIKDDWATVFQDASPDRGDAPISGGADARPSPALGGER